MLTKAASAPSLSARFPGYEAEHSDKVSKGWREQLAGWARKIAEANKDSHFDAIGGL
jgi:hypothetical protein